MAGPDTSGRCGNSTLAEEAYRIYTEIHSAANARQPRVPGKSRGPSNAGLAVFATYRGEDGPGRWSHQLSAAKPRWGATDCMSGENEWLGRLTTRNTQVPRTNDPDSTPLQNLRISVPLRISARAHVARRIRAPVASVWAGLPTF